MTQNLSTIRSKIRVTATEDVQNDRRFGIMILSEQHLTEKSN